ncbi:hypothetical protein J7F03_30565 [Streptomyces sp. ISL-43]|uniref:hypothetical protein n=1 Tax=Streptomyces sp. ISL-43 TaxID=2819183 RepID=UPI001BEBDE06|nr:hypothetical protein [Streptomyces sp. ISL-43]MBT2451338.1 hypothetical protein [Streptomyces sp. ISL-43]
MLPGSGSESKEKGDEGGRTYQDAMDAMYPGVLDAMKPAMPGVEPQESSNGNSECGGPDLLDGKDGSKVVSSHVVSLIGLASDQRSPEELTSGVVSRLTSQEGWQLEQRSDSSLVGHPGGVLKYVKKPGVGTVMISAYQFKTTSGDAIPKLYANIVTDCLRNPEWQKE